jgi:light-regulated signal transduction histidine kinase (bacteriophytochrome)
LLGCIDHFGEEIELECEPGAAGSARFVLTQAGPSLCSGARRGAGMQRVEILERKLHRERNARRQAEALLEEKSLEIYRVNQALEQRAAQAESANRDLETFSYSVSHDLRSPLRSIDGFSRALLEDCEKELTDEGRSHLRRIRAAAQRMGHLIDDLLGLARVGRTELRRQEVDLTQISREILDELGSAEPARDVACRVAEGLCAQADPALIRIVMENLLRNAWKFTSKTAHAQIEVGAGEGDGRGFFFVRDNGAGFDMAHAGKLFGPFQRLHATSEFQGSGIGLATVARILSRHGGSIRATASVGEGATFYFTLPDVGSEK